MKAQAKISLEQIWRKLTNLERRQEYLEDALLSAEDIKALKEAEKDLKAGRTIGFKDVKKKLGLK